MDYAKVLRPVDGIQIVDDILAQFGVETLEGRIGPLLWGVGGHIHFLDMPPGMFVGEHPHSRESFVYTVRGRWVLCSHGYRHLMRPGNLFWFGPGAPTGYEVPFDEPAYIMCFNAKKQESPDTFVDYLRNKFGPQCEAEHQSGIPFLLDELAADHPARLFAHQVNPARY
ncbi:MAG: cupin domain-containing protein [Chloroflexota bacterium]